MSVSLTDFLPSAWHLFVPTWVDVEVFHPEPDASKLAAVRLATRERPGHGPQAKLIVTVGRIDAQKQPELLFDAFARIAEAQPDAVLVYVGDGILRAGLQARVDASESGTRQQRAP